MWLDDDKDKSITLQNWVNFTNLFGGLGEGEGGGGKGTHD